MTFFLRSKYWFILGLCGMYSLAHGQENREPKIPVPTILPADTILKWSKEYDVFDLIEAVKHRRRNEKREYDLYDFEDYYHNPELKRIFLSWLNPLEMGAKELQKWALHDFQRDSSAIIINLKNFIKDNDAPYSFEEIQKNHELFDFYYRFIESKLREESFRGNYQRAIKKSALPYGYTLLWFHTEIAYPEAYAIFKDWWAEEGNSVKSEYYIPLLRMGDPAALDSLDKQIEEMRQAILGDEISDIDLSVSLFLGRLIYDRDRSFLYEKVFRLFDVKSKYFYWERTGQMTSPYCYILHLRAMELFDKTDSKLLDRYSQSGISNVVTKTNMKDCGILKENEEALVQLIWDKIERMRLSEEYWRRNMPYNLSPDD